MQHHLYRKESLMHPSSQEAMKKFINGYLDRTKPLKIIEIGSRDPTSNNTLSATYRELFANEGWTFHGLDLAPGNGVDIVSQEPYRYPIADGEYDVVVSGQTAEHVLDIFAWIVECARILKPQGLMCIIAPWQWGYHPHPVDCWRFMRDGMRFMLAEKAGLHVLSVYEHADDCIGIAKKDGIKEIHIPEEVVKGVDLNIDVAERMARKDKF
jgi:hypothetical protein